MDGGVMAKQVHEIRDPIHGFIRVDEQERKVIDSRPFQRLRHIHQLALTYLLYPGATHRRFEHSLGVMELAGRVFDVITNPLNVKNDVARGLVPVHDLPYWRRALRVAALMHDTGHLPFSHAAEADLLLAGWDHERLTDEIIRSEEMRPVWEEIKVLPRDVAKLALGPRKFGPGKHRVEMFTPWEEILAKIIVGDAFGVDRMDYLLRDAYHTGVAYGQIDHLRLIDTLRILPESRTNEPALGVEEGGIHTVEGLLLARYAMYSQVYFHHVRRVYDYHLTEFLKRWLPGGRFPVTPAEHLARSDNEVLVALVQAAGDPSHPGHDHARRIARREHFRLLSRQNPDDLAVNPEAIRAVAVASAGRFGAESVHYFTYEEANVQFHFPVVQHDGRTFSFTSQWFSMTAESSLPWGSRRSSSRFPASRRLTSTSLRNTEKMHESG
jgi:HD superfamily phosphohydrolase